MLHKTRGIVIKSTNYSETSIVVQVFTETFGMQSYMVNGARKSKARLPSNLFQPLNLLEMVVYHKQTANIQRISEARNYPFYENVPFDIVKSSLVLFLNELLYKSIRYHDQDEALFDFLSHSLEVLDHCNAGVANFHLWFALRLTRYLGFKPEDQNAGLEFFDLKEGGYVNYIPAHPYFISGETKGKFAQLQQANAHSFAHINMNSAQRRDLMKSIIDYYAFRIDDFGEFKSLAVLQELLHS